MILEISNYELISNHFNSRFSLLPYYYTYNLFVFICYLFVMQKHITIFMKIKLNIIASKEYIEVNLQVGSCLFSIYKVQKKM